MPPSGAHSSDLQRREERILQATWFGVLGNLLIAGVKIGSRPPDEEHSFGHGRAEDLAAFAISVVLGGASVELGLRAVGRLLSPAPLGISWPWLLASIPY